MAGGRRAYQLFTVKVHLVDPLNPVAILEQNLELQPGVILFQAVLQVPFALPCGADMEPFRPTSEGECPSVCLYCIGCALAWACHPHSPSQQRAEEETYDCTGQGLLFKSLPAREAQIRCANNAKEHATWTSDSAPDLPLMPLS